MITVVGKRLFKQSKQYPIDNRVTVIGGVRLWSVLRLLTAAVAVSMDVSVLELQR